jgi:hypothetical protein
VTVNDLVSALPLTVVAGRDRLDARVTGGYASDLLSNVMGFAAAGNIWVTMRGTRISWRWLPWPDWRRWP